MIDVCNILNLWENIFIGYMHEVDFVKRDEGDSVIYRNLKWGRGGYRQILGGGGKHEFTLIYMNLQPKFYNKKH